MIGGLAGRALHTALVLCQVLDRRCIYGCQMVVQDFKNFGPLNELGTPWRLESSLDASLVKPDCSKMKGEQCNNIKCIV